MALETAFAPAERDLQDQVLRQHGKLSALPFIRDFLDSVPNMTTVLNTHRQIVFANRAFMDFLGLETEAQVLGKKTGEAMGRVYPDFLGRRPGEAVGCIRAHLTPGGCGTTPFCQTCGAVISILNSQQFKRLDIQECRMICGEKGKNETALDLRVWSRPIEVDGEVFTVFSVVDISDEKRRKMLERIFFHDVINTAGCIKGLADLMIETHMTDSEIKEMTSMICESADQLLEEISAQRELSAAESGDLKAELRPLQSSELLTQVIRQFHSYNTAKDKILVVDPSAESFRFISDPHLLRRVLINLVKNALEASLPGQVITVGAHASGETVSFNVHNPAVIPPSVQLQIFMRSFSTKGSGRGIGTYSIKLLTEKYLHGQVAFVSQAGVGTRFTVTYPRGSGDA
jgi:nitrogen-specific signal transduction histidine kinase